MIFLNNFNILNNHFHWDEIKTLDLFSGTGNLAFEFGSRGAKDITAVDAHFDCVKFIMKTSEELELPIIAIKSDVYKFIKSCNLDFDIIPSETFLYVVIFFSVTIKFL